MTRHPWFGLRPWRRHSTVLLVLGSFYVMIGLSAIFTTSTKDRDTALTLALHLMSLRAWGLVFVIIGLMAVLSSRWPPQSVTWGYSAPAGLSALWASFYFFGVMLGAPASTLSGSIVWFALAFIWWAIAGLANPTPRLSRREKRRLLR